MKNKTLLLYFSDTHLGSDKSSSELEVVDAFVKDVKARIKHMDYQDVFVIIGGDLVCAASEKNYKRFHDNVILPLKDILSIGLDHFIVVPGNHDVSQASVQDVIETYLPIVKQKYSEDQFCSLVKKEANERVLFGKFDDFKKYVALLDKENYSLTVNTYPINNNWVVYAVNSAILSCGGYKDWNDKGYLAIDKARLYEILREDRYPHRILLMHHPDSHCLDWVGHELRKYYGEYFDLVLTGHEHDQQLYCHQYKENKYR